MDSDDDLMSGVSSEDDVLQDESDDGNASGDGEFADSCLVIGATILTAERKQTSASTNQSLT
jgi:hypothetical protein